MCCDCDSGCDDSGCDDTGCDDTGCDDTGCDDTGCDDTGCDDGGDEGNGDAAGTKLENNAAPLEAAGVLTVPRYTDEGSPATVAPW